MKKKVPIVAFLSGTMLLFFLMLILFFIYGSIGSMQGWPPLNLSLFNEMTIFKSIVSENGSFQLAFGPGILLISLAGGMLNALLALWLNPK
ncbi:hypothetical protein IC619_007870 [Hazenella sp. IB182353]|uniref:hypothetical protein n=1 Tax=Polycladospora coralii TaxID=2771432 RepID=UPI001746F259|nr:hypothetical protein [Polycladospora coralii]MBS7530408.1 hypothetical protein [Polycladospora coralii]